MLLSLAYSSCPSVSYYYVQTLIDEKVLGESIFSVERHLHGLSADWTIELSVFLAMIYVVKETLAT